MSPGKFTRGGQLRWGGPTDLTAKGDGRGRGRSGLNRIWRRSTIERGFEMALSLRGDTFDRPAFGAGPAVAVGAEEELLLVDAMSGDLSASLLTKSYG
jgi:hypothetical protein